MKLIIDIDDEMYDFTINARKARTYTAEHYVDLILNGTPLEEELEKVKNRIDYVRNCGMGKNKSLEYIEKYINKEISETKGENK